MTVELIATFTNGLGMAHINSSSHSIFTGNRVRINVNCKYLENEATYFVIVLIIAVSNQHVARRSGVLNLLQTWGYICSFLSIRGLRSYKWGQFIETPRQFNKNAPKLGLLLQTGAHITQFSLTKSIISETLTLLCLSVFFSTRF
jgi:hypothetical protein